MNPRLARLLQLLELKKEATRKAYIKLLRAKEQLEQNKLREDQLKGYRLDYIQQLEVLGKEGASILRVRNRINFINHLDAALVQLSAVLTQLTKVRSNAESLYRQAKISEEGVEKLISRVKKADELKEQRQEQKETDEFAQKQWYGKNNNEK